MPYPGAFHFFLSSLPTVRIQPSALGNVSRIRQGGQASMAFYGRHSLLIFLMALHLWVVWFLALLDGHQRQAFVLTVTSCSFFFVSKFSTFVSEFSTKHTLSSKESKQSIGHSSVL